MLYLATRAVLLVVIGLLEIGVGPVVYAQSDRSSRPARHTPDWVLILDGDRVDWPGVVSTGGLDSVRAVGRRLVDHFQREGYYYAQLDSTTVDTTSSPHTIRLYVRQGPRVEVGRLQIEGADAVAASDLRGLMDTQVGAPLISQQFEADVQALLDRYENEGHPLAQIRVTETKLDSAFPPRLQLTLEIDEGPSLWFKRIDVPDDARTSPGLLARLAGLKKGAPLRNYDPDAVRQSLQESPFLESVGRPTLQVTPDGGAVLQVPIEEGPPGTFDLALGYLPPSRSRDEGRLVGSGRLLLEHLFGGGRRFDLSLDRRPGQASIFDLSISDPYIFGLPFRLTGQFEGEQRDSTYGERSYGLTAGYQFGGAFELTGGFSREVVTPGQAGAQLRANRQRIPRSRTLFYGLGIRYESIDRPANPRRGIRLNVEVEQGRKRRSFQRVTAGSDTTRQRESFRQDRFRSTVRAFVPLFDRQVLVVGGNGSVLRSRDYDQSDLFRFGGAQSLRGYDEDRFLGNVTLRGLLEYRFQLDRRSYAYMFGDLGYIARPELGAAPARREWHPGYGVGVQIQTGVGLITTSYALNPEIDTPADGRIHFGLSLGL